MNQNLLDTWEFTAHRASVTPVVPDGCRDLIMQKPVGGGPRWFVSPLYDQTISASTEANVYMKGFRLKPGVRINERLLLTAVGDDVCDDNEVFNYLDDFVYYNPAVGEALACFSGGVKTVADAARQCGVSVRSLQRLMLIETGRSPSFWLMLAKIRKAARQLPEPAELAEIADISGYADQAHLSRECKRWFGLSPGRLRDSPRVLNQLFESGYG